MGVTICGDNEVLYPSNLVSLSGFSDLIQGRNNSSSVYFSNLSVLWLYMDNYDFLVQCTAFDFKGFFVFLASQSATNTFW